MNFTLLTDYPWYFIIFCILAGALVAFFTYRKNKIAEDSKKWYRWPVWLLMILRGLTVSILAFLLLSPVVRSMFKKVEKPIVVLAVDNSQSVLLNKDSVYYKTQFKQDVQALADKLKDDYDLRTFTFGDKIEENLDVDFKEKQTDISSLYDEVYNRFYNQNIGAVITLTDGIYNQGQNPQYTTQRFNAPFYTVALGDTVPPRDALIKNVRYNQIVYSGNFFPLQVQLRSMGFPNENVEVKITNKGNTVFRQQLKVEGNSFYKEIEASIEAKVPGLQRYHIEITQLKDEMSYVNNSFDVFINVLDSRRKILIVAESPHPDVAALKKSIERNQFYEVQAYTYADFQKNVGVNENKLKNFQLVILHQLPGISNNAQQLINILKEAEVPVWYILGAQTSLPNFNAIDAGVQIQSAGARANESMGYVNNQFTLFTLSDDVNKVLSTFPPLIAPFGEYKVSDRQNIALHQQIGRVKSEMPLLLFSRSGKQKTGVLTGEGIWRWFLFDFAANQSQKATDEIVNKAVQYLSVKTDSRLFRVRPTANLFYEDDKITFEAEAYNESFEPLKDALIQMTIKNEQNKSFDFTFQPRGDSYFLDAGFLPAGAYTFNAQTTISGKKYALAGEFIVKAVEMEFIETTANHGLLYTIASKQGGKMIYPKDMKELPSMLEKREDIQSVAYMQTDLRELIHFKWLFFLLLAFLAAEWFLRKYFGAY